MTDPVTLLVFTDGRRECLAQTIRSFWNMCYGKITQAIMIDDSADRGYAAWLDQEFFNFDRIIHHRQRLGFGGAIIDGWKQVAPAAGWVFHLEDDFLFNRAINLDALIEVLIHEPKLAQLVYKRQAWNPQEQAAGGIVEQDPTAYADKEYNGFHWLEHDKFFSTNPCLYSTDIVKVGWPCEEHSEGMFTFKLRDLGYRFGFVGKRSDPPAVTHIGLERVGNGY